MKRLIPRCQPGSLLGITSKYPQLEYNEHLYDNNSQITNLDLFRNTYKTYVDTYNLYISMLSHPEAFNNLQIQDQYNLTKDCYNTFLKLYSGIDDLILKSDEYAIKPGYRLRIDTYDLLGKDYPYTGHSAMRLERSNGTPVGGAALSKTGDSPDYNLLSSNNCAGLTSGALEAIFHKKVPTLLGVALPKRVKDWVLDNVDDATTSQNLTDGHTVLEIPLSLDQAIAYLNYVKDYTKHQVALNSPEYTNRSVTLANENLAEAKENLNSGFDNTHNEAGVSLKELAYGALAVKSIYDKLINKKSSR